MSDLALAPNVIRLRWSLFFHSDGSPYWDFDIIKSVPMGKDRMPSEWRYTFAYQGWKYIVLVDCFRHGQKEFDEKEISKRVSEIVRDLCKSSLVMNLTSLNSGKSKIVRLTMDDFQKLGGFNPMTMEL